MLFWSASAAHHQYDKDRDLQENEQTPNGYKGFRSIDPSNHLNIEKTFVGI